MERWQDIEGYSNYEVSTHGRIRNKRLNIIMKTHSNRGGYEQLCLRENGGKHTCKVHRLVAETFIPNPDNLPQVNHIDGDKWNNNISNLEWCTQQQNLKHAVDNGLAQPINRNKRQVIDTSTGEIYSSICEAANAIGMSESGLRKRINKGQGTLEYLD